MQGVQAGGLHPTMLHCSPRYGDGRAISVGVQPGFGTRFGLPKKEKNSEFCLVYVIYYGLLQFFSISFTKVLFDLI